MIILMEGQRIFFLQILACFCEKSIEVGIKETNFQTTNLLPIFNQIMLYGINLATFLFKLKLVQGNKLFQLLFKIYDKDLA